jgi:FtsH-binding integral membrane protein
MRRYALLAASWAALALATWAVFIAGAGIYWMLRDSKYVNDVMITSVVLCLLLFGFLIWLSSRFQRRSRRFANLS